MKHIQWSTSVILSLCVLSNLVACAAYGDDTNLLSTSINTIEVPGPVHIININSDKCLTVSNASTSNNANVVQYECDYDYPRNEEWYFKDNHIVNSHSGKCLTVLNASIEENAKVVQYTCDSSYPYNENWTLVPVTEFTYHLVNQHSQKCLTILNVSTSDNANAVQYTCDFSAPFNEEWQVELLR